MLKKQYISEKQTFEKMLINTRMTEVSYAETFNLIFSKYVNKASDDNSGWVHIMWNLIIDAPFWVGEKCELEEMLKSNGEIIAMDDRDLAYKLVDIRYNNLIQVQKVEFLERCLCISLDKDMVLAIAYCSDSDYSWILEEYNDKGYEDKKMILCQENELFAKNKASDVEL